MFSDISRYRRIFILVFVIVLVACSKHKPVPPPIVHINPSPQQNYVVTMRVDNSISNISNVEVVKTYEISNIRECSPIDYTFSMGGSHRPQSKKVLAKYVASESHEISTEFSADYFQDENYYAMGICRWGYSGVRYIFEYNDVKYYVVMPEESIRMLLETAYFCRKPQKKKNNFIKVCTLKETALSYGSEGDYFTTTISVKRINKGDGGH